MEKPIEFHAGALPHVANDDALFSRPRVLSEIRERVL